MRIAILSDAHLTDANGTVKHLVLNWLGRELAQKQPDLVAAIGDLTALGTPSQNDAMLTFLRSQAIPFCSTPGNAELRTSPDAAELWRIPPPPATPILLIDSATGAPQQADLAALELLPDNSRYLLATHVPVQDWPSAHRACVERALARKAITTVVAGHQHDDGPDRIRGLDPDKSAGGPPMFAVFDNADGGWKRTTVVMTEADIRPWPLTEREEVFSQLGVSAMHETLETLDAAARLRIPQVELRYSALTQVADAELVTAISRWRGAGGRMLSMHLPNLKPEADGTMAAAVRKTLELGCNRVTLHVPAVAAAEFPRQRERLLDNFLRDMHPLMEAGMDIGIENLHTSPGRTSDELRNYGCTIAECRSWIEDLRQASGNRRHLGFHLDIGHARNNTPFSTRFPVGAWYETLGAEVNGMHIHQVKQEPDGTFLNHRPLTGFFDPLISLSSLVMARQRGILPRAPMLLEVREGLGPEAWLALRAGASLAKEA